MSQRLLYTLENAISFTVEDYREDSAVARKVDRSGQTYLYGFSFRAKYYNS